MIRTAFIALALLAATPAFAETVVLKVQNRSSQAVISLNSFPIVQGAVVQDNVGALTKDVPAGGKANVKLRLTQCGLVHIYVGMADQTQTDATIDTCARRDVIVTD